MQFCGTGHLSLVGFDEGIGFKEGSFLGHEWIKPGRDSCENFSSSGGYEEAVDVTSLVAFLHFRVGVMKEGDTFLHRKHTKTNNFHDKY